MSAAVRRRAADPIAAGVVRRAVLAPCRREPWLAGANVAAALSIIALAATATTAAIIYSRPGGRTQASSAVAPTSGRHDARSNRRSMPTPRKARDGRSSGRAGQRFETLKGGQPRYQAARQPSTQARLGPARVASRPGDRCNSRRPDLQPTGRVIHRPPGAIATAFDSTMTRYALQFRDGTIRCAASPTTRTRPSLSPCCSPHRPFQLQPRRPGRTRPPPMTRVWASHGAAFCVTVWDVDRECGRRERPRVRPGPADPAPTANGSPSLIVAEGSSCTTWQPAGTSARLGVPGVGALRDLTRPGSR